MRQGKNTFIRRNLISEYSVEPCSHNTLTTHNDLRPRPLLNACPIWPHLLQHYMLPCHAYHPITLDKCAPFYIYDVTPIRHLVNHRLLHENRSLLRSLYFAPILFATPGDRTPNLTTITVTTKLLHSLSYTTPLV